MKMLFTHIVPWRNPGRELDVRNICRNPFDSLVRRMDSLFEDVGFKPFSSGRPGEFSPSVDVRETDNEILVTAELPGIDPKDIELTLTKDALTLSGEKKHESEETGEDFQHFERRYGSFRRLIPLTCDVDQDKVEAAFKNGVLNIKLPKAPEAVSPHKRIEIKTS